MRLSSGIAAASAVVALLLTSTPALAADPLDLDILLYQRSELGVSPNPITPLFYVSNRSTDTTATGVTLTVSLAELTGGIRLDGIDPGCARSDAVTVICPQPDMPPRGGGDYVTPVRLVAPGATAVAPAGRLVLTLDAAEGGTKTESYPVHTVPRGTDVEMVTAPVLSSETGQALDMEQTAWNRGLAVERTRQITETVPQGVGIGDLDGAAACRWTGGTLVGRVHWGPVTVTCPYAVSIEPGESFEIREGYGAGSASRFYLVLGKDTPGPFTYRGTVTMDVVNHDDKPANNTAPIVVTSKPNKLDVAVKVKPGARSATWTVSNKGPSAATGWTADLVAPAGTTFRPAAGCTAPTATTLRCASTEWLAPGTSVSRTVKLDVTGTVGAAGSITIGGTGPSAESRPANNKAALTITSGSAGQGGGGSLPITGPSGAVYGLGAVLAGLALLLLGRRRRRLHS